MYNVVNENKIKIVTGFEQAEKFQSRIERQPNEGDLRPHKQNFTSLKKVPKWTLLIILNVTFFIVQRIGITTLSVTTEILIKDNSIIEPFML